MEKVEMALLYAEMGYSVLPLKPGSKEPMGKLVPRGHLDAVRNPQILTDWFRQHPEANLGILPPENVLVLDLDEPSLLDKLIYEVGEGIGEAPRQRTPRGGYHIFLRIEPLPSEGPSLRAWSFPGMDLKGMGKGYVVASPSQVGERVYVWERKLVPPDALPKAPATLLKWLSEAKTRVPEGQGGKEARTHVSVPRFEALLRGHCQKVSSAPEGTRHNTLLRSSLSLGGLLPSLAQDEEERIKRIIRSLLQAATESGLPEEEAIRIILWGLEKGMENPHIPPEPEGTKPEPIDLSQPPRQINWVAERLIPKGALTLWYGPPGAGKSALAAYLSALVAGLEGSFGPYPVQQGRVAILDFEEPLGRMYHLRLHKLGKVSPSSLGVSPSFLGNVLLYAKTRLPMGKSRWEQIKSLLRSEGVSLVILDSFSRAFPIDTNRIADVIHTLEMLEAIAAELDIGFLVLDHTPKLLKGERAVDRGARGSSAKQDIPRSILAFDRGEEPSEGEYMVRITCTKLSYSAKPKPFYLHVRETEDEMEVDWSFVLEEDRAFIKAKTYILGRLAQAGTEGVPRRELVREVVKEEIASESTVKRVLVSLKQEGIIRTKMTLKDRGSPEILTLANPKADT